jgi:hypothetical protein
MNYPGILLMLAFYLSPSSISAQDDSSRPERLLVSNDLILDSLTTDESHNFLLVLDGNRFVAGVANQISVDLVVTVFAPDSTVLRSVASKATR